MKKMDLNNIVEKILEADKHYYNTGKSIMTDQEYGNLKDFVKSQDPEHPLFLKVGDNVRDSIWEKAEHQIPMGSLEKINSEEEFISWSSKFPDQEFIFEPKFDGLSLSISYEDGEFVQAISRGDGTIGENLSDNVRKMVGFFNTLPKSFTGSLRCEILLPYGDFKAINSVLPEEDRYENCRNAASGICRRLDGKYCKYLQLMYYDIQSEDKLDELEKIHLLEKLVGTFVTTYKMLNAQGMINSFEQLKNDRSSLPYQIDGAVIKINSWKKQEELGWTNNRPKGQIAWKFDAVGSATPLLDIILEVGRTGVVTPVGLCEPVKIDGSTISRVTLHNIAQIKKLGIGIGDLIMIVKANDVIPHVEAVIESKGNFFEIPTKCPSCGSELENNSIQLFCKSESCPAKSHSRIMNWIKVVGIENLGESTLNVLEDNGLVKSISDLYKITVDDLNRFERYADKSSNKIIQNIQNSKLLTLDKFLAGVGIPTLSIKTASDLAENFKSIDNILSLTVSDVMKIKGYSDISANAIVSGLNKFEVEIRELLSIIKIKNNSEGGKLSGLSFCFTGAMEKPRSYYQGLVNINGGKNDSSVTKTTTYLVCNENKGSSKSQKAEKLGVKIITTDDFMNLVGEVKEDIDH
jgi:DNA ligase (NAD+)